MSNFTAFQPFVSHPFVHTTQTQRRNPPLQLPDYAASAGRPHMAAPRLQPPKRTIEGIPSQVHFWRLKFVSDHRQENRIKNTQKNTHKQITRSFAHISTHITNSTRKRQYSFYSFIHLFIHSFIHSLSSAPHTNSRVCLFF